MLCWSIGCGDSAPNRHILLTSKAFSSFANGRLAPRQTASSLHGSSSRAVTNGPRATPVHRHGAPCLARSSHASAFTTRVPSPQTASRAGRLFALHARSPIEENTMNFQPLADRLLVRRIEEQETIRGGIIIPDTAKEKPQEGEVVAVGPGRLTEDGKRVAVEVKKGDRILVGKYSGTDVKIDGTEYVILREDEVLGVLSKSSK